MKFLLVFNFCFKFKTKVGVIPHLLAASAYCQVITLSNYSSTSQCSDLFVKEGERVIFRSKVDVSRSPDTGVIVNYDIKRKHQLRFEHFCYLVIPNECTQRTNHYCSCQPLASAGMYQVYINMSAHKVNSQANLRGELIFKQTSFFSEVQNFPAIYDLQSVLLKVYINDQQMNMQNCTTTTNETSVIIIVRCIDGCPCELELSDSNSNQTWKQGYDMISYRPTNEIVDKIDMTLRYKMCGKSEFVQCEIKNVETIHLLQKKTALVSEQIAVAVVITVTIMVMIGVAVIRRKSIKRALRLLLHKKNNSEELDIERSNLILLIEDKKCSKNFSERCCTVSEKKCSKNFSERYRIVSKNQLTASQKLITPVDSFDESLLPIRYRDKKLIQFIKSVSDLTANVIFSKCSTEKIKSRKLLRRQADGKISDIEIFENGYNMYRTKHKKIISCPCNECRDSNTKSTKWAEIYVSTSNFTLRNQMKRNSSIVIYLEKFDLKMKGNPLNIDSNRCQIKCVICNQDDLTKIMEMKKILDESIDLSIDVNNQFQNFKDIDKIYISVSYLKNKSRHICIGEWRQKFQGYAEGSVFSYSSDLHLHSGCPVVLVGYSETTNSDYYMRREGSGVIPSYSRSVIALNQNLRTVVT